MKKKGFYVSFWKKKKKDQNLCLVLGHRLLRCKPEPLSILRYPTKKKPEDIEKKRKENIRFWLCWWSQLLCSSSYHVTILHILYLRIIPRRRYPFRIGMFKDWMTGLQGKRKPIRFNVHELVHGYRPTFVISTTSTLYFGVTLWKNN